MVSVSFAVSAKPNIVRAFEGFERPCSNRLYWRRVLSLNVYATCWLAYSLYTWIDGMWITVSWVLYIAAWHCSAIALADIVLIDFLVTAFTSSVINVTSSFARFRCRASCCFPRKSLVFKQMILYPSSGSLVVNISVVQEVGTVRMDVLVMRSKFLKYSQMRVLAQRPKLTKRC